jgi:ubiquinone/menaquinone biosynthesis C-methylase UbiE
VNWPLLAAGAVLLAALAALLYWQITLAEGVYLGRRVVVLLYDRFAPRYDAVKQFNETDEAWFLGWPLAQALQGVTTSLVLDVATGTARLPLALFRQPNFTGRIVGLDLSREMLRRAAENTLAYQDRVTFLWQDATQLPFPDQVFHAVTCLEALEFLPDAHATLAEMTRVLRAGGLLFISNRIGIGKRWMPTRTMSQGALTALLESLGLEDVRTAVWQVDYDIVWARKPAASTSGFLGRGGPPPATLPHLLRCPHCACASLDRQDNAFVCDACGRHYPLAVDGVVELNH